MVFNIKWRINGKDGEIYKYFGIVMSADEEIEGKVRHRQHEICKL